MTEDEYQSILRDFDYHFHRIRQALMYEPSGETGISITSSNE